MKMPEPKRRKTGSLSKSEGQKLKSEYNQGGAPYGFVRNLSKASNLPLSKVRQFLQW